MSQNYIGHDYMSQNYIGHKYMNNAIHIRIQSCAHRYEHLHVYKCISESKYGKTTYIYGTGGKWQQLYQQKTRTHMHMRAVCIHSSLIHTRLDTSTQEYIHVNKKFRDMCTDMSIDLWIDMGAHAYRHL